MDTEDKNLPAIGEMLKELEERHQEEEKKLFEMYFFDKGVYDYSVSYHYMKQEAVKNIETERIMKVTMNALVIVLFFFMNIMLVTIKILSEKEQNEKRAEFLNCMGMRRKDRMRYIKKELLRYYYILPGLIAMIFALLYMFIVFHIRMYTVTDMRRFSSYMLSFWAGYFIINSLIMWVISTIYAHKLEK